MGTVSCNYERTFSYSVNTRVMVRSVYKLKRYFSFDIKAIIVLNSDISKDKTLKEEVSQGDG